jgi:hypothetical protein
MKGGEITLDSIDSTIKETINPIPPMPESPTRRILMAPFRVLGKVIEAIGSALGPLGRFIGTVIRVIFGLIIFFLGLALTITPLVALAAYFGASDADYRMMMNDFPYELFTDMVPLWLVVASMGLLIIPGIVILLLGLSVLAQKNLIGSRFGLVALGLWLLCIGIAAFQIPKIVAQFKEESWYKSEAALPVSKGTLILRLNDQSDEATFNQVNLKIEGKADSVVTLKQEFFSRGRTKAEALANAQKLTYPYAVMDSVVTFEEGFDLSAMNQFRDQKLNLILQVPFDRPFIMERSLLDILRNTLYDNGYRSSDVSSNSVWVFNEAGLICLTCVRDQSDSEEENNWDAEKEELDSLQKAKIDSATRAKFSESFFMKD